MQILANALPGFRDMRAPLTAGYLWLVFVWLLATPDFSRRPAGETSGSAYDLAQSAGRLWVGIAVGTLAYFVGSVTQMATEWLEQRWDRRKVVAVKRRRSGEGSPVRQERTPELPSRRAIEEKWDLALPRLLHFEEALREPNRWTNSAYKAIESAFARADQEPDLPATVLVGAEPSLYAEVDRLRAEGDLRLTVAPPLFALIMLLTFGVSPWFVVSLLGLAALVMQGVMRKKESRGLVISAMSAGRLVSPAYKDFETVVDGYVGEAQAALDLEQKLQRERQEMQQQPGL